MLPVPLHGALPDAGTHEPERGHTARGGEPVHRHGRGGRRRPDARGGRTNDELVAAVLKQIAELKAMAGEQQ
jgi:hypothetical protein